MQRERVFANGSYMAAQFAYIQKSFVMYGIVPEIDVRNEKLGRYRPDNVNVMRMHQGRRMQLLLWSHSPRTK